MLLGPKKVVKQLCLPCDLVLHNRPVSLCDEEGEPFRLAHDETFSLRCCLSDKVAAVPTITMGVGGDRQKSKKECCCNFDRLAKNNNEWPVYVAPHRLCPLHDDQRIFISIQKGYLMACNFEAEVVYGNSRYFGSLLSFEDKGE